MTCTAIRPGLVAICIALSFGTSACKRGGGESSSAAKFIPEGAQFVVGVAVEKALWQSGPRAVVEVRLERDQVLAEQIELAQGCNLDPWKLDQLVIAGTTKGDYAGVMVGAGFGNRENMRCFSSAAGKRGGGDPVEVSFDGNRVTIGEHSVGYFVDDKTFVFASVSWDAAVHELVDGQGTAAVDGTLKAAFALVDTGKHLWVVADGSGDLGRALAREVGGLDGLKVAGASLDFGGGGLALAIAGEFADEGAATRAAGDARQGLEGFEDLGGVPSGVLDSFLVAATGTKVSASAQASAGDVTLMVAAMRAQALMWSERSPVVGGVPSTGE